MRFKTSVVLALCIGGGGGPCNGQSEGRLPTETLPMQKGTRWIYRGDVAWQATGEGAKVHRSRLDWKMEIVDSLQRGPYQAALMIGHPKDLTWYEKGRQRGCNILIGVGDRKYYFMECRPSASRLKLSLTESDISSMISQENLIFKLPVRQGDVFGGDPERGVKDEMYAWYVQSVRQRTLPGIRGTSGARPRTEYILTYRTNPDHEIVSYVPGIGLTAYVYRHHGTVSEVDVKLVEFHSPGGRIRAAAGNPKP